MSTISKKQFKQYIECFDFTGLFNQLGWTYLDEQTPVRLKEETYHRKLRKNYPDYIKEESSEIPEKEKKGRKKS